MDYSRHCPTGTCTADMDPAVAAVVAEEVEEVVVVVVE